MTIEVLTVDRKLIFLADITYHPLSGPALTRRPPGAWIPPTVAPVAAHGVSHATIIYHTTAPPHRSFPSL